MLFLLPVTINLLLSYYLVYTAGPVHGRVHRRAVYRAV